MLRADFPQEEHLIFIFHSQRYLKAMANIDNVSENINLITSDSRTGISSQANKTNLETEPTQQHVTTHTI